jgi:hypothetical protein
MVLNIPEFHAIVGVLAKRHQQNFIARISTHQQLHFDAFKCLQGRKHPLKVKVTCLFRSV